jgi:hypothetical protein
MGQLNVGGAVSLKVEQINHPQLLPQSWQFNGKVNSNLANTELMGVLKASAGMSVSLNLNALHEGCLWLEGKMQVNGEQEAQALSRIVTAWPPLLTVSGGNVSANVAFEQTQAGETSLVGNLVFADWSGTNDRTVWRKMNGTVGFVLENDRLDVTTPGLTMAEVNTGLPIGPVLQLFR